MHIHKVRVRNFRSILDATLLCDDLTALVGRNGSGKSAFLNAIDLFYDSSSRVTEEDYYAENTSNDIEIAVTFCALRSEAKTLFAGYLDNESLTVAKVFSTSGGATSGNYYGSKLQNPDFLPIRNAGGAMDIRRAYTELRTTQEYSSLPPASSADAVRAALAQREGSHPSRCSPQRDDGQFFGFRQVAHGYLGRYTRFVHIPAVRDARDDASDTKGSPVTEIMDLVVRNALSSRQDIKDFQQRTQDEYREIMNPEQLTELHRLEGSLSSTLRSFVADASVHLQWSEFDEISIPMPHAIVKLQEDGFRSTVERTGHGLQRAFIITLFQYLSAAQRMNISESSAQGEADGDVVPNLVLAIEEPELYQHPSRQRHLSSVLSNLATGAIPGVSERTQILYTTHSPLLVGLDHFSQIRVVRKASHGSDRPKITQLKRADMTQVARELWCASQSKQEEFTAETLRPRLQAIMTPWMNEGFFANVVVLVEGEDDRAAILGVAGSMQHDFDSMGIAVIPCLGKNNLDRPLVIFRQLQIPAYVVWDSDYCSDNANPESNRYILRLLGLPEEDWPEFVRESGACFKNNLESTLESEIGKSLFEELLSIAKEEYGIEKRGQALKTASIIRRVVEDAASQGSVSNSLSRIVCSIVGLNK